MQVSSELALEVQETSLGAKVHPIIITPLVITPIVILPIIIKAIAILPIIALSQAIPGDFDHFGNLIQRRPEIISLFVSDEPIYFLYCL